MKSRPKFEYVTKFRLCDKNHFLILKGISILMVVITHFFSRYLNNPGLLPLQSVATAVFLLCSGYGVSESFNTRTNLKHYWENKAVKIWVPSVVVTVLYSVIEGGDGISWVSANPLALHGWFLYLLFGNYLAFWLAFYFLQSKTARILSLFAVSVLGFFVLESETVGAQMLCFPMGVMFSQLGWKYSVREFKIKGRILLCGILAIAATGAYLLSGLTDQVLLGNFLQMLYSLSGAILLLVGTFYVQKIGVFGIFVPVGIISYALYLTHEKVLSLLDDRLEWRVAVAVIAAMFVIATVFSCLCDLFIWYNKKMRRSKGAHIKGSMR